MLHLYFLCFFTANLFWFWPVRDRNCKTNKSGGLRKKCSAKGGIPQAALSIQIPTRGASACAARDLNYFDFSSFVI